MYDDGELSKIEDMILISGHMSGELKNHLDTNSREMMITSQNYLEDSKLHTKESYENTGSDMADLNSVILTAASGTRMIANMKRNSFNQSKSSTLHNFSKSMSYEPTSSKNLRKAISDVNMHPCEDNVSYAMDILTSNDQELSPGVSDSKFHLSVPFSSCKVCGDTSSGIHYGVRTCEGCKGFFRRAIGEEYSEKMHCSNDARCLIMMGTRNRCQYCRLKKCLKLGMSRRAVKIGRRSATDILSMEDSVDDESYDDMSTSDAGFRLKLDTPLSPCKVCGDASSGIHYGVLTCEGCKGFFRRALTEDCHKKMQCSNNKRCSVMMGTRNRCQYCRLRKCLKLGMSRGAVKMGRRRASDRQSMDDSMDEVDGRCDDDGEETGMNFSEFGPDLQDLAVIAKCNDYKRRLQEAGISGPRNKSGAVSDLDCEIEKARAKDKVLMNRKKKTGLSTNDEPVNSSLNNVTYAAQDEPDSTLKNEVGQNAPIDHLSFNLSQADAGQKKVMTQAVRPETQPIPQSLQQLFSVQGGQQQQPMVFVLDDKVMSFLGHKSQEKMDDSQSTMAWSQEPTMSHLTSGATSRNPPKKRPFPSLDNMKMEKNDNTFDSGITYVSIQPSPKLPTTSISVANASQYSNIHVTSNQMQQALGLNRSVNSTIQLANTLEAAFRDTFKGHIDVSNRYTHDQINNLNENALNILFGDQNWKVRSTVHINPHIQSITWDAFHHRFNEIIQDVVKLAKRIPGFAELDTDDRVNLVRSGCFEAGCIIHSYYINTMNDAWIGARDFVLIRTQMKLVLPLEESFIDQLFEYSIRFQQFKLTHAEISLLCAVMLINPERPGLVNKDKVSRLQDELAQALQQQVFSNHSNGLSLLPKVLMSTSSLRELSLEHRRQLNSLKGRFTFPNDLYAETFDLI